MPGLWGWKRAGTILPSSGVEDGVVTEEGVRPTQKDVCVPAGGDSIGLSGMAGGGSRLRAVRVGVCECGRWVGSHSHVHV